MSSELTLRVDGGRHLMLPQAPHIGGSVRFRSGDERSGGLLKPDTDLSDKNTRRKLFDVKTTQVIFNGVQT